MADDAEDLGIDRPRLVGDQADAGLGQVDELARRTAPRREEVVGLVDDDPVRRADLGAQTAHGVQEPCGRANLLLAVEAAQVDGHRRRPVAEELFELVGAALVDARFAGHYDDPLVLGERGVVALGVEQHDDMVLAHQPLDEHAGQRRFAAARRAGDQQALPEGGIGHGPAVIRGAQWDGRLAPPVAHGLQIGRQRAANQLAHAGAVGRVGDEVGMLGERRHGVGDRDGEPHLGEEGVVVLGIPDAHGVVTEMPMRASAWRRPISFDTPLGRIITASLLKMICSSSPSRRIVSSTATSWGTMVATMTRPVQYGTPAARRPVSRLGGGGSARSSTRFARGS